MRLAIIAAAVASCAIAVPTAAEEARKPRVFPVSAVEQGLQAFRDICLANVGNGAAQIAAAKAAPYAMTYARGPETNVTYENERMFAAFKNEGGRSFCMVAQRIEAGTDQTAAAAAMEKLLPTGGVIRMKDEPGQVAWANPTAKPLTIYMHTRQDTGGDQLIGSYMVGVVTN